MSSQVPYKGAAPAMNDLIGGQVDAMFDQTNTALPQVRGGRIAAIALTSRAAHGAVPDVPPLAEKALPGFEAATWYGLYAPKGTPKEVIERLRRRTEGDEGHRVHQEDAEQGIHLLPEAQYGPEAFGKHTAAEIEKWRKVVTEAKITLD